MLGANVITPFRLGPLTRSSRHGATPAVIGYRRRRPRREAVPSRARLGRAVPYGSMILPPPHGPGDEDRIRADQVTMASIAEGDQASFGRVVADETPRLLRFVRSLLATSPAEAEEILQESLLRLWRQAGDWQPSGRIGTWLHRVAYRLSIDAIRRHRPSVDIDSIAEDLDDGAPAPDARLARLDDARAIRSAIDRLPARQRTALILCHFQGLGQAEAAAVMGVGEHAYESLLARARRRLRAEFTRADGEGGGP